MQHICNTKPTYFYLPLFFKNKEGDVAGRELTFSENEFIVSKTDTKGRITYGNELFIKMSGYTEDELLHQPHNILRHPQMPAVIFEYLWKNIQQKKEVFAYVINQTKEKDFYWVFAHVTASIDENDTIIGFHSARRSPKRSSLEVIKPLYNKLLNAERSGGLESSRKMLQTILKEKGVSYEEFIFSF